MRCLFACLLLAALANPIQAELPAADHVPQYLQDISVTIRAGGAEGSGVLVERGGQCFVLTAGHVVAGLRKTRELIDIATGTNRTVVEFDRPKILKVLVEDGKEVGRLELDTDVIRYSDSNNGEDLALLRVLKKDYVKASATFYGGKEMPNIGTQLFHVGSLLGEMGSNSMTSGIVSQHGRLINKKDFTQTTVTAFPGSSGGGVYTTKGEYVGMLVRGAGEGFNLIVPITRMRSWSERAKVAWALDPKVALPSAEELAKLPVEDTGVSFSRAEKAGSAPPDRPPGSSSEKAHATDFLLQINRPKPLYDFLRVKRSVERVDPQLAP